jgi:diguanylate cyclase (GGDEF)-like protein
VARRPVDSRTERAASSGKAADRALAANDPQFVATVHRTAMESSPDGILVVDADARIISFNRRFVEMWRLPHEIVAAGDDKPVLATVTACLKDPEKFLERVRYLYDHPDEKGHDELELADGRMFDRHTAALRDSDGRYIGRIWFFRDITDRKKAEAQIARLAREDALTGLANRAVFVEAVRQRLAWARRGGGAFAVLYLDLDHFKDVNDTLSHPIGDELLKQVAQRLKAQVRDTDTVARFGGDEFAILAAGIGDPGDAGMLAGKVLEIVAAPYSIQGNEIRIGTSIGISVFEAGADDAETLMSRADMALYRAKAEGRHTYRFFADSMDAEVRSRVDLGLQLRRAIGTEQVFIEYQPQVRMEDGRIVGLEALARWRHPARGLLLPEEFIPAAEHSGQIVALGQWTLREACRQAKAWMDAGLDLPVMCVNISTVQFKSPKEVEKLIRSTLAETALPPARLEIELTETAVMDAARGHKRAFRRIREIGARMAIDDFGTGYFSLSYLRQSPVDRIKIAQDLVYVMMQDEAAAAVIQATIGLAQVLKIGVIAEGVETAEQAARLAQWGCLEAQGYLFSMPVSASAVPGLLRRAKLAPRPAATI